MHYFLDDSSLSTIKSTLLSRGSHFSWFDLGLAMGLYYHTLKVIQTECFNDDDRLRDALAAWLRRKDMVPQQGLPSWRSLTRALSHPLVNQRRLADEIATHHKVCHVK